MRTRARNLWRGPTGKDDSMGVLVDADCSSSDQLTETRPTISSLLRTLSFFRRHSSIVTGPLSPALTGHEMDTSKLGGGSDA